MSGIVAAALSGGCCCRPQEGCTCSNPNRPGAVIDRGITALSVDSDMSLDDAERNNTCFAFGCSCPCSAGALLIGPPGGPFYSYQNNGSIVDPDFVEDTECESLACRAGCCGGCPEYTCRSSFGTCIAEQNVAGFASWSSVTRTSVENVAGVWSWFPQQVGYCIDPNNPAVRVRKFCPFSGAGFGLLPNGETVDANGQYLNPVTGQYTGGNIGRYRAYRAVEVAGCCGPGSEGSRDCIYRVRVAIGYLFEYELQRIFSQSVGGVMRGIPIAIYINGIVAQYVKPCQSPTDTVLGTYTLSYQPQYDYAEEDQECGRIRYFRERLASFPSTLTVS